MADINIVNQGDVKKFIITSQNPVLDMELCDFYVELTWGMFRQKKTIQKSEMLYGTEGEYVMRVDTSKMVGKVTARFVWYAIDTDIDPDNRRREIDEQTIMFVTTDPCPGKVSAPVRHRNGDTRTWRSLPNLSTTHHTQRRVSLRAA